MTFDSDTTAKFANFGSVEAFKQAIGFKELISSTFTMRKSPNSKFKTPEILDFLVDAQILGLPRFEHINDLRYDPSYLKTKGDINEFPEESAFRRLFKALETELLPFTAIKGYNPRYHGRPSIKGKVYFIAETAELVHLKAYGGKTHSNGEFLDFFKETEEKLPHNYVPKGVRLDKGFFDEKNFEYFETRTLLYVCKAPMRSGLKKVVNYLNEQNLWH